MRSRVEKLSIGVSWSMKAVIFAVFCVALFFHNIMLAVAAAFALGFSIAPIVVARNLGKHLPLAVDFPVTIALLLHTIGLAFNLYHIEDWWWWDIMTHFLGTVAVATLAFLIVFSLHDMHKIKVNARLMAFASFVTAMAIGALWEVGEFYFDRIFATHTLGDIIDTIQDLQFDALGGAFVAYLGAYYVNRKNLLSNNK